MPLRNLIKSEPPKDKLDKNMTIERQKGNHFKTK